MKPRNYIVFIVLVLLSVFPQFLLINGKVGYYGELVREFYLPYNNGLEPEFSIVPWGNGIVVPSISIIQGGMANITYLYITPNGSKLLFNVTTLAGSSIIASAYTNGEQLVLYYKVNIDQNAYQLQSYIYPAKTQIPDFLPASSFQKTVQNIVFNSSITFISYYPNQPGWYFLYNTLTNYNPINGIPVYAYGYGQDLMKGGKYNIIYLTTKNSSGVYLLAIIYTNPYEIYKMNLVWSYKLSSDNVWMYQVNNFLIVYDSNKFIIFNVANNFSIYKTITLSNTSMGAFPLGISNSSLFILNYSTVSVSIGIISPKLGLLKNIIAINYNNISSPPIAMMYNNQNISLVVNDTVYLIDATQGRVIYNVTLGSPIVGIGNYIYSAEKIGGYLKISVYQVKWGEIPSTTSTTSPLTTTSTTTSNTLTTFTTTSTQTNFTTTSSSSTSTLTTSNIIPTTTSLTTVKSNSSITNTTLGVVGSSNNGIDLRLIVIIIVAVLIIGTAIYLLRRR